MNSIRFLLKEDVLGIHQKQIDRYGGIHGIRDMGLLESAIAMPEFSFDGHFVHDSISLMGAAYIFHIIKNHPFLDGNKRTGIVTGLTFLRQNGLIIRWVRDQMVELAVDVATSKITKEEIAQALLLMACEA